MKKVDPRGMEAIGRRLRHTRIAAGYPVQAAWCRVVGISQPAWNNYEAAFRRISLDHAWKVVALTGVSLDWIYGGSKRGMPSELMDGIARLEAKDGGATETKAPASGNRKARNKG